MSTYTSEACEAGGGVSITKEDDVLQWWLSDCLTGHHNKTAELSGKRR